MVSPGQNELTRPILWVQQPTGKGLCSSLRWFRSMQSHTAGNHGHFPTTSPSYWTSPTLNNTQVNIRKVSLLIMESAELPIDILRVWFCIVWFLVETKQLYEQPCQPPSCLSSRPSYLFIRPTKVGRIMVWCVLSIRPTDRPEPNRRRMINILGILDLPNYY